MRVPLVEGVAAVVFLSAAAVVAVRAAGSRVALGEPRTVTASGASVPTVALDPSGRSGLIAWVAGSDVYVADAAGGEPRRVNDLRGDAAPHEQAPAQVALAAGGRAYVLWQNNRIIAGRKYPASDLRFSRSEDGGRSWSPAVTVNSDRGGAPSSHTFHDLLAAPDGTLFASWIDGRGREGAGSSARHGGSSEIRVARSRDGGRSWEPELVVDGDVCPCCRTSLAMGPDGSLLVAWRKVFQGDVRDVVVARLSPGARAFSPPVRVHQDGWVFPGCPHAGPSLAVSSGGRVHVAWYTGREDRQGLWLASAGDDLRFGAPEPLLTADWVPPTQVALAADEARVMVAWDDRRAPGAPPRLSVVGGGTEQELARTGRSPALAVAGGRVLTAWLEGDAVRARSSR